jgi:GT2 family glycosyltransferase
MSGAAHGGRFVPPGARADAAVIVVTYNSRNELPALLDSLRVEAAQHRLRVIVADNASGDDTLAVARTHPDVVCVSTGGNLGYAGGINAAVAHAGDARALLILNPDLRVRPGAVGALFRTVADRADAGVIAPRIVDDAGQTAMSISHEPSVFRAACDAVLGPIWRGRPPAFSEWDRRRTAYERRHAVEWVSGAALMIPRAVADRVGAWDERFFLYSEETDYCRRVRDAGFEVWFDPSAVVEHSQGKSGSSPQLDALLSVNRVRYVRKHAPRAATLYRAVAILGAFLRGIRSPSQRVSLRVLRDERRWASLPRAVPGAAPRS